MLVTSDSSSFRTFLQASQKVLTTTPELSTELHEMLKTAIGTSDSSIPIALIENFGKHLNLLKENTEILQKAIQHNDFDIFKSCLKYAEHPFTVEQIRKNLEVKLQKIPEKYSQYLDEFEYLTNHLSILETQRFLKIGSVPQFKKLQNLMSVELLKELLSIEAGRIQLSRFLGNTPERTQSPIPTKLAC